MFWFFWNKFKLRASKDEIWTVRQLLINFHGAFNWRAYDADKEISKEARLLFQEGLQLWSNNNIEWALIKFKQALIIEENWAYLNYEIWYTYWLLANYDEALKYYKKVMDIESRWFFSVITETYILTKVIDNKYSKEVYKKYIEIYDTPIGTVKEWLCKIFIEKHPGINIIYPIYLETLIFNLNLEEASKIIEKLDWIEIDIDSKMYIKLSQSLYYILLWNKKEAYSCLFWIYRMDTSRGIDNLADYINQNLIKQ
jgi:tetratricopeptide (TPR) repeat protein